MPDEKNFILAGTDSTTFPAQASKESLFYPLEFKVPVWTSLCDINDCAQITNLTVCANAAPKKLRPCMPIPPFLETVLIGQGGTSIPGLISTSVAKISSFTAEHEDDSDFPSANNHAQLILNWIWATMKEDFHSLYAASSINPIIIVRSKEIREALSMLSFPPTKNQRSTTLRLLVNSPPT